MTILDKLFVKETGKRYAKISKPIITSYKVEQLEGDYNTPPMQTEYLLSATVGVVFSCNQAQYKDALKNAENLFLMKLYEDVLQDLTEVKGLLYAGDDSAALEAITTIQQNLLGRV